MNLQGKVSGVKDCYRSDNGRIGGLSFRQDEEKQTCVWNTEFWQKEEVGGWHS